MILKPRMSEKAYKNSLDSNTYIFVVPKNANKHQIKEAVEAQYSVAVTNVTTVLQNGKVSRSVRLGNRKARPILGNRSDIKKAYVTLKESDKIKIFEEEEQK